MSEPAKTPTPAGRSATKKELPDHFKGYKHVWVFIEQERGQVHPVSWELLGAGRQLADKLKVDLAAVVIGPEGEATRQAAAEAFCYGADLAYLVADNLLTDYRNESYTKALTDVVNTYKPEILLLGATTLGRDLAGSVATTLLTWLTADVHDLYPQLSAADGNGAPAGDADAGTCAARYRADRYPSARPGRGRYRHQGTVVPAGPRIRQVESRLCRRRGSGRPWARIAGT